MFLKPAEPTKRDHYNDLGVSKDGTKAEIKRAYHTLALLHHPDKIASNRAADPSEFQKVSAAFSTLSDPVTKAEYDSEYAKLHKSWTDHRRELREWERFDVIERRRVEDEQRAQQQAITNHQRRAEAEVAASRRREEALRHNHVVDAYDTRRAGMVELIAREAQRLKAEHQRKEEEQAQLRAAEEEAERVRAAELRRRKDREAAEEQRFRQAKKERSKRRAEQNKRIRKRHRECRIWGNITQATCGCEGCKYDIYFDTNKRKHPGEAEYWKEKEESYRVTKYVEEEQKRITEQKDKEEAARQLKLRGERQANDRKKAARSRVAKTASDQASQKQRKEQEKKAQLGLATEHIERQQQEFLVQSKTKNEKDLGANEVTMNIGWSKMKGKSQCLFCGDAIHYYFFVCPDGGAVACNPCKNKLSRFTPPLEVVVDNDEVEEGQASSEDVHDNESAIDVPSSPASVATCPETPSASPTETLAGSDSAINGNDAVDRRATSDQDARDRGVTETNQRTPNIANAPIATESISE